MTGDGGAIAFTAAAAAGKIDTGVVVRAAGFAGHALCCADTRLARETIPAIAAVREGGRDTDVGFAGSGIAELGGTITDVAAAANRVVAGIAARAAEETIGATRTARIGGVRPFDGATLLFGVTDGASTTARVVTALLGESQQSGPQGTPDGQVQAAPSQV